MTEVSDSDEIITKYKFDLTNSPNVFRKINDKNKPKGYLTLPIRNNNLNTYLNNSSNLDGDIVKNIDTLITLIKNIWPSISAAYISNLSSINVKTFEDLFLMTSDKTKASSDIFRIMFEVGPSSGTNLSYWVFDYMITEDKIAHTKKPTVSKQDLFLIRN